MSHLSLLLLSLLSSLPVRGHVRDAVTRAPIPGVTVQVAGSTSATVTDADGAYALVVDDGRRLRFVRLGYTTLETTPRDTVLDVFLVPSVRSLEGVTVTALRANHAAPRHRGRAGTPLLRTGDAAPPLRHSLDHVILRRWRVLQLYVHAAARH